MRRWVRPIWTHNIVRTLYTQGVPGTSVLNSLDRDVNVYRFEPDGEFTAQSLTARSILRSQSLSPLDLYFFASSSHNGSPKILPRVECVLVTFSHVKALVADDHALLFDVHRPVVLRFAQRLKTHLQGFRIPTSCAWYPGMEIPQTEVGAAPPFECRVLEGILGGVHAKYKRRVDCFRPAINGVLRDLTTHRLTEEVIHRLLPLKNSLSGFERSNDSLLTCLMELLGDEQELADMLVTEKTHRGGEAPAVAEHLHEDFVVIFEHYCHAFRTIADEAFRLRYAIQSAQEMAAIGMAQYRTRLIRLNVHMAMLTVGFALGALICSGFGMNLPSGLEEHPTAFYWAVVGSFTLAGSVYGGGLYYLEHHTHKTRERVDDIRNVQAVFEELDDVQDLVLSHWDRHPEAGLSMADLKAILDEHSTTPITQEAMKLIFRVFDRNEDGVLDRPDVVQFICEKHGGGQIE